jgi:hypothetical protein
MLLMLLMLLLLDEVGLAHLPLIISRGRLI